MNEREIFSEAIHRPNAERAAYLDEVCGTSGSLRARIEHLLALHDDRDPLLDLRPDSLMLELSGPTAGTAGRLSALEPGCVAGPYRLLEKIGEGGMGEVWVARQTEPLRRKVALKVLKPGMGSRAVLARFEQERQALALMDHPNIARVFDAGLTPTGQPYFAMELVNGLPLTTYCDEARLAPRARLELMLLVCYAVQHAHQKGIIHRDLKPANVLVTLIDGRPVPKVIDFGVAKATGDKLTDESLSTQFGMVVGTLDYMSPEQAGFSGLDVDTRTDIYSLGVILYELLTGLRPVDLQRGGQPLPEVIRRLHDSEPTTPSHRLSTSDSLPTMAGLRQTEPKQLMAMLRGDLDWVVMKCLEKQRARRYETAEGLARDLQRFLADEPVEARPPSTAYRLGKFFARNRGRVVAAGLLLLALVGGTAGTTVGLIRADAARRAEQVARKAEQAANAQTLKRLAQLEKANELLASVFRDLDPRQVEREGRPLRAILADKLDRAVAQLDGEAVGDAVFVASLQQRLGQSLLSLGEAKKAIVVLKKALDTHHERLGADHEKALYSKTLLAAAYRSDFDWGRAVPLFEEVVDRYQATLGPHHMKTLESMDSLAVVYHESGKLQLALPLFEKVLALEKTHLGPDHLCTLYTMHNLASAYSTARKFKQATQLLEESLRRKRAMFGPGDYRLLDTVNALAIAYQEAGKSDQAIPLFEEALKLLRERVGPDHVETLIVLSNLGWAHWMTKQFDRSVPLYEEAVRRFEAKHGPRHYYTLWAKGNLGANYLRVGRASAALPLLEEACQAAGKHHQFHAFDSVLLECYLTVGMKEKAAALAKERKLTVPGPLDSTLQSLETAWSAVMTFTKRRVDGPKPPGPGQ